MYINNSSESTSRRCTFCGRPEPEPGTLDMYVCVRSPSSSCSFSSLKRVFHDEPWRYSTIPYLGPLKVLVDLIEDLFEGPTKLYKIDKKVTDSIGKEKDMIEDGKKYDDGKPKMGMVFAYFAPALKLVAECGTYGWRKYTDGGEWDKNWDRLTNGKQRYTDAFLRHTMAYLEGEWLDPESGLPHLAHATWSLCAVICYELKERVSE